MHIVLVVQAHRVKGNIISRVARGDFFFLRLRRNRFRRSDVKHGEKKLKRMHRQLKPRKCLCNTAK